MPHRLVLPMLLMFCLRAWSADARPASADPQLEARMVRITSDLRCLVCQNQSIADSHSGLATDLRQQVREQLQQGKTDDEIRAYMTQRYGDFILYSPPVKTRTLALWAGPALIVVAGLAGLYAQLRRRQRLEPQAFDPAPRHDDPTDT